MWHSYVTHNLLWTEGWLPLLIVIILAGIGWYFHSFVLLALAASFFLFSLYFFRNPERSAPAAHHDQTLLVSPADGKVVSITPVDDPTLGAVWNIAIFLSPLDVHVNWIPQSGSITKVEYRPGKFLVAFAPKSSEVNERNDVYFTTLTGNRCCVRQIAGFVARRIACWVKEGDSLAVGSQFGMIRFGSRVELLVPRTTQILVTEGQYVYGGHTIVGRTL